MKVTGQDPAKTAELTLGRGRGKDKPQPANREQSTGKSAEIKTRASLTTDRAKEAIRKEADVRAERVAELRQQIRRGQHRIDSGKLAEKILNDSLREDLERP